MLSHMKAQGKEKNTRTADLFPACLTLITQQHPPPSPPPSGAPPFQTELLSGAALSSGMFCMFSDYRHITFAYGPSCDACKS